MLSDDDWNNNALGEERGYVERIIYIRTKRVGYLIGTAGRTIRGFENNSGAKIDILTPNSCNNETPVMLSGSFESVRNVLRQITDLYHKNNLSSVLFQHVWKDRGDRTENGERNIIGHEEMKISASLIGQIQDVIPSIENDFKVHVEVGKECEDQHGIIPIGLVGSAANVANATQRINEAIAKTSTSEEETVSDTEDSNDFNSEGSSGDDDDDDDDDEIQILNSSNLFRELVTIQNPLDFDVLQSARRRNRVKFEMMYLNIDSYEVVISGAFASVQNAKFQLVHNKI